MPFSQSTSFARRPQSRSARLAFGLTEAQLPSHPLPEYEGGRIEAEYCYASLSLGEVEVNALAFSPDGTALAAGLGDGTVRFYDLKTRQWGLRTPPLHEGGIQAIALTPDGKWMATCGADPNVAITNLRTGTVRRLATGGTVLFLAISPDGKTLAASTDNEYPEDDPGDDFIAAATPPASVYLWSIPGFRLRRRLTAPDSVPYVSFSHTQRLFVASHGEGMVFSLTSGKKIWSRKGEYSRTGSISPNGRYVAYGEEFWDIDAGKYLGGAVWQHNHSAFSRSGGIFVSGSRGDGSYIADGRTGRPLAELKVFQDFAALSPDGSLLAGGFGTWEIYFYRIDEIALRKIARAGANAVKRQIVQERLAMAVEMGDLGQMKMAILNGADPNGVTIGETTLLVHAACHGQPEAFAALVAAGASFSPEDAEAMGEIFVGAVMSRSVAMVQWLLGHGAALPNDSDGKTALDLCTDVDIQKILIDAGAKS